jgi:hypothetical protein
MTTDDRDTTGPASTWRWGAIGAGPQAQRAAPTPRDQAVRGTTSGPPRATGGVFATQKRVRMRSLPSPDPPDATLADVRSGPHAERTLGRRRQVLLARHYRERGDSIAQIARLLDRAPATVKGYLHDPTGEKAKARKAGYAGTCDRCGAPTSGADGKDRAPRHCQRCKPQSRPRWTREAVRGAHRFWLEQFGFVASSVDWSGTHARRRGGAALERYQSARWPSGPVIRRLYGSPAAARADAFPAGHNR